MTTLYPKAVLFDMDGVITATASLHFKAWKQTFDELLKRIGQQEFSREDYLKYVDGKPRYQGVHDFLVSRGIDLPWGEPSDKPSFDTICGIGNAKNEKFRTLVDKLGVEVFESSLKFIRELKRSNVKVGLISASKNCRHIIGKAGIENLFDVIVDGVKASELKLAPKPEPDIFIQAALELGVSPAETVVVEDAIAGVEAGRNGGFKMVIGIARNNRPEELFKGGADIAVSDLSQISLEDLKRWFSREPVYLFDAWQEEPVTLFRDDPRYNPIYKLPAREIFFGTKEVALFLDYDGTLTPIVSRPELAILSEDMRRLIKELNRRYFVAVVSGRAREDVENLVKIPELPYSGSHGFDIRIGQQVMIHPEARKLIPLMAKLADEFERELGSIPGLLIERKQFSFAIHYRLVDENRYLKKIEETVNVKTSDIPEVRVMHGKKVFEILPAFPWDKGKAVRWIMKALKVGWDTHSIIYIGDDITDEYAFRVLQGRGAGILVSETSRPSSANFYLKSVDDVQKLFKLMLQRS